jgi:hypothetical protein
LSTVWHEEVVVENGSGVKIDVGFDTCFIFCDISFMDFELFSTVATDSDETATFFRDRRSMDNDLGSSKHFESLSSFRVLDISFLTRDN